AHPIRLRFGRGARAGGGAWRGSVVWRRPGWRIGTAAVVRLPDSFQEDLGVAARRDGAAVVVAHHPRHDSRGLRPHGGPRVARVVRLEKRLPYRDADVLSEQHARRALPAGG